MKNKKDIEIILYFRNKANLAQFFLKNTRPKLKESIKTIYFGEEFCEHLNPSLKSLKQAYQICSQNNKSLHFMTGIATNNTLSNYRKIFDFLGAKQNKSSVIVNDWGVLRLLKQNYPRLEPILGRLLIKNKRLIFNNPHPDPERINKNLLNKIAKNQLSQMKETNLSIKEFSSLLLRFGVKKIDIDIPPQGINLNNARSFNYGFFYPWGYLTGGRICGNNPYSKIDVSLKKCSHLYCLKENNKLIKNGYNTQILKFGNTVFYRVRIDNNLLSYFSRIIYEADLALNASYHDKVLNSLTLRNYEI